MAEPRPAAIGTDADERDDVHPHVHRGRVPDVEKHLRHIPNGVPGHMSPGRVRDLEPPILGRPASPLVTGRSLADRVARHGQLTG